MSNYRELKLWQNAIDLVGNIYNTTKSFPKEEQYGLTNQIRRSAVSIPSNIAEGSGRNSTKEFINFLGIAHGSSFELETQLLIAKNAGFLAKDEFDEMSKNLIEIQKMNNGLKRSLSEKIN